jgi:hypothetical protein
MSCITFGGMRVDRAVAREVLERVQPFGIEAALAAMENLGREKLDKVKQLENAIEQARFEAARARRQYGWKTLLRSHADAVASMDLFVVPTISFRILYGLLILRQSHAERFCG